MVRTEEAQPFFESIVVCPQIPDSTLSQLLKVFTDNVLDGVDVTNSPSVTEIRVLDTYWSDHCRHTTFSTELKDVKFDDGFYKKPIEEAYNDYLNTFKNLYEERSDKFVCLMDIALLAMKRLKKEGKLQDPVSYTHLDVYKRQLHAYSQSMTGFF